MSTATIGKKNTAYRGLASSIQRELNIAYPSELSYAGFYDGLHHLAHRTPVYCKDQNGNITKSMSHYQYADIAFDDEDAENGNLKYFVEHGLTRFERR